MGDVRTVKLKFSQLEFLEDNPRTIKEPRFKILSERIKSDPTFFDNRPCLVNFIDGRYICYAGFQRAHAAAKVLKWKEIPCSVENDVPTDLMRRRAIYDNTHDGEWNSEVLSSWEYEVEEYREMGVPEWVFGGDGEEEDEVKLEAKEDEYEPPAEIITDIVLGDLFEIGRHRLLCGDSTSADDVGKLLNGEKPFLMVTDPPYGVEYDPEWWAVVNEDGPESNRALGVVQNDDRADWTDSWALSPAKVFYIFHADIFSPVVAKSMVNCGIILRNLIIWAKNKHSFGRGHYHHKHEPCWYGVRKGDSAGWIGDHSQTTLWEIERNNNNETGHSTQKPVECMARPIRNHEGEVYDPFLGSGTTMVAAHQLNRRCYGIEIDPKYCQVIVDRMLKLDPTLEIKRNGRPYQK